MDGFSGYNQISIHPEDQHKTTFICPWGTFAYRKIPFGLKNSGATFQRVMSYAFHDIKHIIEAYLDNLVARSRKRTDHPSHLRLVFERCRFYKIRLNPNKCVFAVTSNWLLGFIVSNEGIRVDPFKVEAIIQLPPPSSIRQLQSLQGKANFLRWFISNYAKITKGFMHLLWKGVPFVWDDFAVVVQCLEKGISLCSTFESTRLCRGLVGPELRYSPVEKLALVAVQAIQWLHHYILLRKTFVLAMDNPFQCVLRLATAQRILHASYFWRSLFKDCAEVVKCCHPCQIYTRKVRAHPAPLFLVVTVDPFTKWGIDFTTCNPPSVANHKYIIVVVDYFTKWAEAMPTYKNDSEIASLFLFNQIISTFGIPREIVTDHGSHFQNQLMSELALKLGFWQEHSSRYYPQANGQVEVVNKTLKTILQRTIDKNQSNWHLMLYPALWAYQTSIKTATETSSLEERLLHLEYLDEQRRDAATVNEAHKKRVKTQYDKAIRP
eukprot:PITA_19998